MKVARNSYLDNATEIMSTEFISGNTAPIPAYDKNGVKVVMHIASNKPRDDVLVIVISTMSMNTEAVRKFSFQAAVPKVSFLRIYQEIVMLNTIFYNIPSK